MDAIFVRWLSCGLITRKSCEAVKEKSPGQQFCVSGDFFYNNLETKSDFVLVNRLSWIFERRNLSKPKGEIYIIPPMPPMAQEVQDGLVQRSIR